MNLGVAALVEDAALLWPQVVDAAVADVAHRDAAPVQGHQGQRGAHLPCGAVVEGVDAVENECYNREEKEIDASVIGELVMRQLQQIDEVAYVRFASVYREFKDANTFMDELKKIVK